MAVWIYFVRFIYVIDTNMKLQALTTQISTISPLSISRWWVAIMDTMALVENSSLMHLRSLKISPSALYTPKPWLVKRSSKPTILTLTPKVTMWDAPPADTRASARSRTFRRTLMACWLELQLSTLTICRVGLECCPDTLAYHPENRTFRASYCR
jgi:hypothetical protein